MSNWIQWGLTIIGTTIGVIIGYALSDWLINNFGLLWGSILGTIIIIFLMGVTYYFIIPGLNEPIKKEELEWTKQK